MRAARSASRSEQPIFGARRLLARAEAEEAIRLRMELALRREQEEQDKREQALKRKAEPDKKRHELQLFGTGFCQVNPARLTNQIKEASTVEA